MTSKMVQDQAVIYSTVLDEITEGNWDGTVEECLGRLAELAEGIKGAAEELEKKHGPISGLRIIGGKTYDSAVEYKFIFKRPMTEREQAAELANEQIARNRELKKLHMFAAKMGKKVVDQ